MLEHTSLSRIDAELLGKMLEKLQGKQEDIVHNLEQLLQDSQVQRVGECVSSLEAFRHYLEDYRLKNLAREAIEGRLLVLKSTPLTDPSFPKIY